MSDIELLSTSPSGKYQAWKMVDEDEEDLPEVRLFVGPANKPQNARHINNVFGEVWAEWLEQPDEKPVLYCGGENISCIVLYGRRELTVCSSDIMREPISLYAKPSPDGLHIASITSELRKPVRVEVTEIVTGDIVATFEADSFEWLEDGNLQVNNAWYLIRKIDGAYIDGMSLEEQEATLSLLDSSKTRYEDVYDSVMLDLTYDPVKHHITSYTEVQEQEE